MAADATGQRAVVERQQNGAQAQVVEKGVVTDAFGSPMLYISVTQSELVKTADYENVMLGPVQVAGYVIDGPDDQVKEQIRRLRRMCDESLSEDRQVLYNELQARAAAGTPARQPPTSPLGQSR